MLRFRTTRYRKALSINCHLMPLKRFLFVASFKRTLASRLSLYRVLKLLALADQGRLELGLVCDLD